MLSAVADRVRVMVGVSAGGDRRGVWRGLRPAALLVSVVLEVVVSGCAEEEPVPIMPDPTTPTAAPSATEEATPEPETAEEFIRRWTEEALRAQTTGDTKAYRKITRLCESCRRFADNVDRIYSEGGSVELKTLEVVRIERPAKDIDQYEVVRRVGETLVYDSAGAVQDSYTGGREPVTVFLTKADGGPWLIRETQSR